MKKIRGIILMVLCAALITALFSSCAQQNGSKNTSPAPVEKNGGGGKPEELKLSASYGEVYKALKSLDYGKNTGIGVSGLGMDTGAAGDGAASESAAADAPAATPEQAENDYSGTNVQVSGVDEGDIVKTDGKYIYALRDNRLRILEAAGENTRLLSDTLLFENTENNTEGVYKNVYAPEIYIYGTRLAVLLSRYSWEEHNENGEYSYDEEETTSVLIYDVSDPASPALASELGQDGSEISTRLIGSTLYAVSLYYVRDMNEDEPETYIPRVYDRGDGKLLEAGCIAIMPDVRSTAHTVICAYDINSGAVTASQSLVGGVSDIYMNGTSLYLYFGTYYEEETGKRSESVYSVTDYVSGSKTELYRYDLSAGLELKASGSVEGVPVNQFALDEKDGYLRIVTTIDTYSWTEYKDEEMDFTNHVSGDSTRYNALYVLDGTLNQVGSISRLAEDERVYSVRFDGDTGYFVTFRNVDPLFSVDLSDPKNPVILGDLKIPGFSQYMHVYGTGRLFGLGMDADEETGRTNGMKMSMFDTSDPSNVTEKHVLMLDSDYSEALYNHKAILISPEKNIIAFPAGAGYAIYGYSDDNGFFLRAKIESDGEWYWSGNTRGLYIGEFAYVIFDDFVSVLNMQDFKESAKIVF